eukprot:GSChrysophyteH2.ASY1.ANO1.1042.1 assembled CDS
MKLKTKKRGKKARLLASTRDSRSNDAYPFAYHEIVRLKIDGVSRMGAGIAYIDVPVGVGASIKDSHNKAMRSWVVTVPTVLPGEIVEARIYRNHNGYSEADLFNVVEPSPVRIEPLCPHFSDCGGCQYQMVDVETQRKWKKKQVETMFRRIGNFDDVKVSDCEGTDLHYGYRTKITPHYNKPKDIDSLLIGFHRRGTRTTIDIVQCMLATSAINTEFTAARQRVKGNLRRDGPSKKGATLLFREGNNMKVATDPRELVSQSVRGTTFTYTAGDFFQNNADALELLLKHVHSLLDGDDCDYLIDTYCGNGLFSLTAHNRFSECYGIEISELAVKAAVKNAAANDINNVTFVVGAAENIFKNVVHLDNDRTTVIIDPPRKGCDDAFLSQLRLFRPKKIVYVSCDPSTQARDARSIVDSGYTIRNITPVDMFPQTRHIENVMCFIRNE